MKYSLFGKFLFVQFCVVIRLFGSYKLFQSCIIVPSRRKLLSMVSDRTKVIFDTLDNKIVTGGAGGSSTLDGFVRLDNAWNSLKNGGWKIEPKPIVFNKENEKLQSTLNYDVIVSGGTLGIFYALTLQQLGYNVCVIERNKIAGRKQEWNISRKELNTLIRLGVLTVEDSEAILGIEFNPVRVGFKSDTSVTSSDEFQLYVTDILNLGVKPDVLIELVKRKFESKGGVVMENAVIERFNTYSDGVEVVCTGDGSDRVTVSTRLVLDAMGNGSPIAKQIRGTSQPDGICIVVGSCAAGFDARNNTYSDVIYTDTPLTKKKESQLQYFWEAFPAGTGPTERTTYLFTYMDASAERPSMAEIMDDYWELLPRYQGVDVAQLQFRRILYGMFPTYRASPIHCPFPRILQVGDASGIQSPLSFGGFGSLTRHLERIVGGLKEALDAELLSAEDLSAINAYQPNLSACWMFQRAMSVPINRNPDERLVIGTLSNSFSAMEKLGDETMRPFLQDVLQFVPLLRTLLLAAVQDPLTPFKIVPHVGIPAMLDFFSHFAAMGWYTLLSTTLSEPLMALTAPDSLLDAATRFRIRRQVEAWKFGSGLDYFDHE